MLGEDNLDAWVENGFGEMDDVEASPLAYTMEGGDDVTAAANAAAAAAAGEEGKEEPELTSEEIEASINAYNEYYPPANFEGMVAAMEKSWRTIILSRGKQGAKAMRNPTGRGREGGREGMQVSFLSTCIYQKIV